MTLRPLGIVALLVLAAACRQPADDSAIAIDETANGAELANSSGEAVAPSEATGNLDTPDGNLSSRDPDQVAGMPLSPPATKPTIPAQYQGRWGMNANDCDPKKADIAKGLIVIDSNTLKFYEARATLKEQRPAIATSFAGLFGFSGEGMKWEKVETFTRTGDTLKRADKDGSYTYQRCK